MTQKVLIIKLGYSETLDPEIGNVPSLGDVVRTTPVLHCFKDANVTWLTDETAYPLLKDNPSIDRVLLFNLITILQLQAEQFDIVINLEKVPGICALCDTIKAWSKFGFRFDIWDGQAKSYPGSHEALRIYGDLESKKYANRIWQEVLFEMVGCAWNKEEYILGYKPTNGMTNHFDVGLNWKIGSKWPNKQWVKWSALYDKLCSHGYEVSMQQGENDLHAYMDWINSCKMIVTHDSLGLHLAIALKKKIVALFGPTSTKEVYLYDLGSIISPNGQYDCAPCMKPKCHKDISCMETITVDQVIEEVEKGMR